MADSSSEKYEQELEVPVVAPTLNARDPHEEALSARIVRKLDYTVLPVVTLFYFLSYLDRINIGNARVAGLQKALHLTDHQYQICVSILFVPYIVSEIPSNLVLRKIGAKRMMPALIIVWSIMVTLQGLVSSYQGLLTVRFFLGGVEGPMLPGIVLYLSSFYTRQELSLRLALFFASASLAGAFSGLLAAGLQQMNGVGGLEGWAWIFVIEGLFSFCVGVLGFFTLPSTLEESKILTETEKLFAIQRLQRDRPSVVPTERFSMKEVLRAFSSPHVILLSLIVFMLGTTLYGLALFLPSIVASLGFSPTKTQLLSVGPFLAGFLVTLPTAYLSDRYNKRALPIAFVGSLSIIGFSMYLGSHSKLVTYGSMFLTVPGVFGVAPITMAWMANNTEPYYRRATSTALLFVAVNCGGILSTWRFPTSEAPKFVKTTIMDIVFSSFIVVGSLMNAGLLSWMNKNKKRNRDKLLEPYVNEKNPQGGVRAWLELGDKHPDFVYTL